MVARVNPAVLLHEDWYCVEIHVRDRLRQRMMPPPQGQAVPNTDPYVAGVIGESSANPNQRGYPCPNITPVIVVRFGAAIPGELQPVASEEEPADPARFQEILVWVGAKLDGADCNGERARRTLGPIISKIMGAPKTFDERRQQIRPRRPAVLHGWQPSSQHTPLVCTDGPVPLDRREGEDFIFHELTFQTIVGLERADDPQFNC